MVVTYIFIKMSKTHNPSSHHSLLIIVAALGYFVDIYDLLLFSIVRIPSLQSLGLHGQDVTDSGLFLLNVQMIGMLVGGIVWGIVAISKAVYLFCLDQSFYIP